MTNPLQLIAASQQSALAEQDDNGRFCQIATVDETGNPRVRTVIMHDVTDTYIGCIFSKHHKKTPHLASGKFQIYVWHLSQGNQFMVNGHIEPMPRERLLRYWNDQLPTAAKYLDLFYDTAPGHRPASAVESREVLEATFEKHRESLIAAKDPLEMPDHVIGAHFVAERVEHLEVVPTDGRFHKRGLYELGEGGAWAYVSMVP